MTVSFLSHLNVGCFRWMMIVSLVIAFMHIAVKQLAAVLDALDLNVSGLQFTLGNRNGTDDVGRVLLDAAADHEEWVR